MVGIETGRVEAEVRAALFGTAVEPTRIGRYVVQRRLGRGAMGVVYAAEDPELDRRVAVKLVQSSHENSSELRDRLRREAKAMARLSHPNIVQVYDAGVFDHGGEATVYIAMELVEGEDLARWLRTPRPWRETLDVFLQAGRGLAAAHAAGLVHRDFKPDNVFVETEGRVRVGDFGLVRSGASAHAPGSAAQSEGDPLQTDGEAVLGTPAYMAPEVFDARPADARSDQFSYCVALWQGVHGELPFQGKTASELAAAVSSGVPRTPEGTKAPAWLRRVLLRGLRPDPAERFPDMEALIQALGRDGRSPRWRWALGAAAVGAAVVGGWSLVPRSEDPCASSADLGEVWGPPQREALRKSFAAGEGVWVDATADAVQRELDAHADAWLRMRADNCNATRVEGSQPEALMDLRVRCLDDRRAALRALVDVLVEGEEQTLRRATVAVRGLPSLQRCEDAEVLQAATPPPDDPDRAASVEELRETFARVRALSHAGRQPAARELIEPLVARAEATEYVPVIAEAHWHLAELCSDLATYDCAEEHASRAYWAAIETGLDEVAVDTALLLVHVLGVELRRYDDAEQWTKHAEATVQKVGLGGRAEAKLHARIGALRLRQRKHAEAIDRLERAAALAQELDGAESLDLANVRGSLSLALREAGREDEAHREAMRALEVTESQLGAAHPDVAPKLVHVAMGLRSAGKPEEARAMYERALSIVQGAYGPEHRSVGILLINLGNILREAGKDAEARERYLRAREILTKALGPDHFHIATLRSSIALTLQNEGKLDEARALYEETLVAWRNEEGDERRAAGIAANNVGNILLDQGKWAEGLRYHLESREILVAVVGADHIMVASPSEGLGDAYLAAGKPSEAADALEDALRIRRLADEDLRPRLYLVLARALWDSKRNRERAVQLVEAHRDAAEGVGSDARAWLAQNEGSTVLP